jgi:hypothetical protein
MTLHSLQSAEKDNEEQKSQTHHRGAEDAEKNNEIHFKKQSQPCWLSAVKNYSSANSVPLR